MRYKILVVCSVFLLSIACVPKISQHGYSPADIGLWKEVKLGNSTDEVVDLLGEPTLKSAIDENIWYYIHYQVEKPSLFSSTKYNAQSLQIVFKNNKVTKLNKTYIQDKTVYKVNKQSTKITGINDGILRQILNKLDDTLKRS